MYPQLGHKLSKTENVVHKTYFQKHSLACSVAHAMIESMKDFEHITKYVEEETNLDIANICDI